MELLTGKKESSEMFIEVAVSLSWEVQLVTESKTPVCFSNNILIIASFETTSFCKKSILFWSVVIVSYSGMW